MNQQPKQHEKVRLQTVPTPSGRFVSAPPVLIASTHTVDDGCGNCGAVLLHAEPGQVHNLFIHCTLCGSYSTTD